MLALPDDLRATDVEHSACKVARLQRLLDDSCALDPTKEAEALRLAENEL